MISNIDFIYINTFGIWVSLIFKDFGLDLWYAPWPYGPGPLTLVLLRGGGLYQPPNGFRPGAQNRTAKG